MEINAETKKLMKALSSHKIMVREYGEKISVKLMQRISELSAAASLVEISHLPPPRLHQLTGKYQDCFAVDLTRNVRLVFRGLDRDDNVTTVKEAVVGILVRGVIDYHGH